MKFIRIKEYKYLIFMDCFFEFINANQIAKQLVFVSITMQFITLKKLA